MLQGHGGTLDQTVVSPTPKMPHQLGTLCNTRSAKWMTFRNEPARRVDDHLPSISDISLPHHLMSFAMWRQTHSIDGDHLICRKAVVQLTNFDTRWRNTGFGH